jgi:hypothetical protein
MTSAMTRGWRILARGHCSNLQKMMIIPAWISSGSVWEWGWLQKVRVAADLNNENDYGIFGVIVHWIDFFKYTTLRRDRVRRRSCTR